MVTIELNEENLPRLLPRTRDCHKGQLGHALILAGGEGMGGAGLLASQACLRLGAGLVTLATHPQHVAASLARQPEVMVRGVRSSTDLQQVLPQATVLLLGPGLGQSRAAQSLLQQAAQPDVSQVWDADALNLLAANPAHWPEVAQRILTPHPGEAARLLGCTTADIQQDRERAARELACRYASVVVLKGYPSLIAEPSGRLSVCEHGHPVMAGPGFGDVLGGVVAALLAQGMQLADAACLAVWLHARAGEQLATEGRGVVAGDLIAPMRILLEGLNPVFPIPRDGLI